MFEVVDVQQDVAPGARLVVVGVGGGGGNAVGNMVTAGLHGVEAIVANTDAQALGRNQAPTRLQIGAQVTRGLGAGAKPEVGARAAMEDQAAIRAALQGADMVFVTAGMGGGTGTGAAPVVARMAREAGALTVGVVTRPFRFEGRPRARRADAGLDELREAVDTLIVIPNDRLLALAADDTSVEDSFRLADSVLLDAVRSMTDIIQTPGLVNVDFADVVTVMRGAGLALMGTGRASGPGRARSAAHAAISSPLLEGAALDSARGLLVNISGAPGMTLREIDEAMSLIQDAVHADAETIFGAVVDAQLGAEMRITVVVTGFANAPGMPLGSQERVAVQASAAAPRWGISAAPPSFPADDEPCAVVSPGLPVAEASAAPATPPPVPVASADATARLQQLLGLTLPERPVAAAAPAAVADAELTRTVVAQGVEGAAFVRTAADRGQTPRRTPVVRNPFAEARDHPDLEQPAFIRNR